ncbi:MAG: diacylglycerol kinase family protein [Taibaiella sp.]|jgi:YegS/Rv2252/BmrU family lipid kinase
MNTLTAKLKLLFIINKGSGNKTVDYEEVIDTFFNDRDDVTLTKYLLEEHIDCKVLKQYIISVNPDKVIAVGGDGTVKLLAEVLLGSDIPVGILPAGSANGMAKELNIPVNPVAALQLIMDGTPHRIHIVKVNDELCIHLSDIGFNAYVVKTFDAQPGRGMFSYIKAAWKVLWRHYRMKATFSINGRTVQRNAVMIVIANATSYGTGVKINPDGKLDDDLFEVIIIKKISVMEILKMKMSGFTLNPHKTESFQTRSLHIKSRRRVHFQIDGEYRGKVNEVNAEILPASFSIIY